MKSEVPSGWRNLACHKLLWVFQLTPRKWEMRSFSAVADLHHGFSHLVILRHKMATVILLLLIGEGLEQLMLSVC